MADFTPTSGVGWTHNHDYSAGTWAIGVETTPSGPDPGSVGATAVYTSNIPYSITSLSITGGSLTMQGNRKAAVLLRIGIIGDPSSGDSGVGIPGGALIENVVLNVANENPGQLVIQPFTISNIQSVIPVPPDGSAYKLVISLALAGAEWPQDAELECNGEFTATPA